LVACGGPVEMQEHCGEITRDDTWRYGTHLVTCDVVVTSADLRVQGGSDITFADGASIVVEADSSLNIDGDVDEPVVLHGETEAPASWEGIYFRPGSNGNRNRLSSVTLRDAGQFANRTRLGGLLIHGTEVLVEDVVLRDNEGMGLVVADGGALAEGSSGLVSTANTEGPVEAEGASAGSLPFDSDFTGNLGQDKVQVYGVVDRTSVWSAFSDVPYRVSDTLEVEGADGEIATLTVQSGARLQFAEDEMLRVGFGGPGALVADGVVFTTDAAQIAGTWGGVAIEEEAAAHTVLANIEISFGGSYKEAGLYIRQSSPTISGAYIHDNQGCGMLIEGTLANPSISGVSYFANTGVDDFCLDL
jgi:hypothetical protein